MLLSERYPGRDLQAVFDKFRRLGAPYKLAFVDQPLLANSRMALEASEFSRDNGFFRPFHREIFRKYFEVGEDIGQALTILQVAKDIGLDIRELSKALAEYRYAGRLQLAQQVAESLTISNVPTYIINGELKIVGNLPLDEFRNLLTTMAAQTGPKLCAEKEGDN
jgi:predicted DsbA family dithiol-disulfide isomerase